MAEGFEPYHVPQQSRRDKLRIMAQNEPTTGVSLSGCSSLLPFYDPSFLSSDLLTCAAAAAGSHEYYHPPPSGTKDGVNFTGFVGGVFNSSPSLDHLNPSSIHDVDNNNNNNQFLYTPQNLSYDNNNGGGGGGEVVVYKPEPLSLSLSSHYTHQNSSIYTDMVPAIFSGANGSTSNSVPLGPFTGYASILKGSRFLRPAQQLLEELCDVGKGIYTEKASLMELPPLQNPHTNPLDGGDSSGSGGGGDGQRKKSTLISILDEVYKRYKQYYQQMQSVVASFECVAGLGNAAPFANLAMKAMSKHFRYLKNAITEQLQFTNKAHAQISPGKNEGPRFGNGDGSFYNRAVQNSGFLQNQPVWRPQRGLPERAVTVLRAWLFEHFLHPYPTDTDKLMLAKQTGLSRNQVSNWFINARVRLWKPMVEEIHMLETRQKDERNANKSGDENPSTSAQRVEDKTPSKRTRNELPNVPVGNEQPNMSTSYNSFSTHPHSSSVSLTLGLHQNNSIGLSESFPINAAQCFGLGIEGNSEGYVIGGRHFGRDVVGGQLLHDFVG
ncbi:hypothetical protein ES332_A01G259700v1 [Gossypium tomentosum]|uniref:Homeobox domain-containing protein n=1 Tax=Gossypium tomentosum TaxID=34277 RepID=A0A5D2RV57_GOSTO|nr:hypothetical protein ES332_A01G259700v1 [Gossypium tomentosum]